MVIINVYLVFRASFSQRTIRNISHKLSEVTIKKNEYQNYIQQSFSLFRVPVNDVEKSFAEIVCHRTQKPCYIVFIPSHACKACVSTFFSEIKTTDISSENLYLISEVDDQMLKRLWMSHGFDKSKFVSDKYDIFKKSGIKDKLVLMKLCDDFRQHDFLQYDLFLGELLKKFINEI